jgi:hypothetical protein
MVHGPCDSAATGGVWDGVSGAHRYNALAAEQDPGRVEDRSVERREADNLWRPRAWENGAVAAARARRATWPLRRPGDARRRGFRRSRWRSVERRPLNCEPFRDAASSQHQTGDPRAHRTAGRDRPRGGRAVHRPTMLPA